MAFLGKVHAFLGKLGGKKFVASLAGALVVAGAALGWWDETVASTWAQYIVAYIFVQGAADKATGGLTESPKA